MQVQENISLKKFNSFGIDVSAAYFASFSSQEELASILTETDNRKSLLVLGGGSNILFTRNVDGLVLKNEISGISRIGEDEEYYYIKAGAGENWHGFVLHSIENGYAGVENLALIPGSVGASPMQNIGAYGVEIKDVFHSLEAFHIADKMMHQFSNADCGFGYRESVFKHQFKNQFIITSVTYRLRKNPVYNVSYGAITQELEAMNVKELSIQHIAKAVMNIRRSKLPDPAQIGNAGSFFKNPEIDSAVFEKLKLEFPGIVGYPVNNNRIKLAAGWLIEQCGWKGYRKGDAGCHSKQALVLVNYGNADGDAIYELSEAILQSVKNKFAVDLEREVNIY
ncbi:MAG: UDP-N-acetylenolpyruvoylglucosamine reductase [Bacteroidetes bacterium ADurb.Bin397]|nr:MAG: UDP-N-acetylenolpyruvoylglucosamine reductase [Bacteroidetes bacterium ADurb.Bin397]